MLLPILSRHLGKTRNVYHMEGGSSAKAREARGIEPIVSPHDSMGIVTCPFLSVLTTDYKCD